MTTLRLGNLEDTRLSLFTQLTNHQLRSSTEQTQGILIAESQTAIRVAIERGITPLAFLLDERRLVTMEDVLLDVDPSVPVYVLPPDEAERLTGYRVTRGALCAMERPELPALEELAQTASRILVLEGMTDTSNVGAIFRNAAALGAEGVIVGYGCADPLSRRSVRVSMGNVFAVPWTRATDAPTSDVVGKLQAMGFECLALALVDDAVALGSPDLDVGDKVALCFGAEGTGLSSATIAACDRSVIIPMSHGVDSLNVAASSAVAMWELFR